MWPSCALCASLLLIVIKLSDGLDPAQLLFLPVTSLSNDFSAVKIYTIYGGIYCSAHPSSVEETQNLSVRNSHLETSVQNTLALPDREVSNR